jgi:signal transduction histidine kinase
MKWRKWIRYFLPDEEKRDRRFREELERLSVIGCRVIAGVCIGGPLFGLISWLTWAPEVQNFVSVATAVAILLIGLFTLALSFWQKVRPYARALGIANGYLVFMFNSFSGAEIENAVFLLPTNFMMILLVGMAALPIKPLQVAGLGLLMSASVAALFPLLGISPQVLEQLPALMAMSFQITLIGTALTAVVYHQRVVAYRARRAAQESFEELRQAQSKLLMSENAASQGRFAAAVSHELNSPIGALSSALDTLLLAYEKIRVNPERAKALDEVINGATKSARQSSRRLTETVERMKHLTNLDRAEEQMVDLNELWTSTAALLQGELEQRAEVTLDLHPLPRLKCRPQQMSAVFSNLLRNSASSMEKKGTIRVLSDRRGGEVILEIQDDGRGIPSERLPHLFDPSFRVEGGRVATANWGLFISRSIIAEHGGRIEIDSLEGRGTTAKISLPVIAAAA